MRGLRHWLDRWKRGLPSGLRSIVGGRSARSELSGAEPTHSCLDARAATRRELVSLAWPIATAMLGDTMMSMVDTYLVGRLGSAAQGGVGLGSTIAWIGFAFANGFMRGVKVRASYVIGEGRPTHAPVFARAGLLAGLLLGVIAWALMRDIHPLLSVLKPSGGVAHSARDFVAALTWGAPAMFGLAALVQYCQAAGDSRTPMMVQLGGNVLNALLAWALIHGHLGMPALGVRGAGYATAAVQWVTFLALLSRIAPDLKRRAEGAPTVRRALREVSQLGVPTGMQLGFEVLAFATFTAILAGISEHEIAAHQIAMAVIRVSFLPAFAMAEAGSVLVGRSLGARDIAAADRVTSLTLRFAVGFMTACGVLFAIAGGHVATAFNREVAVVGITRNLLLVAAVFQALDAVTITFRSVLRAAKQVRLVAFIGVTIAWVCIPGAAWLLGDKLGMGAMGGWCGFIAETALSSVIYYRLWRRGAWRDAYPTPAVIEFDRDRHTAIAVA